MSGKERGVMKLIWKHFVASLKPNFNRPKLIGTDYFGTKYYEVQVTSTSVRKKPSRYFTPVNEDDHEQEIPAEWESWLRYRRTEPPTIEEIETNYQIAKLKKENAAKIAAKFANSKSETPQLLNAKKGQQSFPTYEEYKND
ncbi:PREDICTED: mimitin, mitochondrial [Dufourea novaeangliae]|uniref:mimitin, mitochondrial n=1 Tax=Dufourea novaeangliae TaxID=178035 RepID=UPI000767D90F|nr:PREDICTED: mimitin, mitochondrial [Dufourea novaeangliae]